MDADLAKASFETNDAKDATKYGLAQAGGIAVFIAMCLAIGIATHKVFEVIIFIPAMYSLRIFVGGYHADTRLRCFFISTLLVLGAFFLMGSGVLQNWTGLLISFASLMVIWLVAPVDNNEKPLSINERLVFRNISRGIGFFWFIVIILAKILGWASIESGIEAGFAVTFFVAATGFIKYRVISKQTTTELMGNK